MMTTQPSQLNPFYGVQTIGLFGIPQIEATRYWLAAWRAQEGPFPAPPGITVWLPIPQTDKLAEYVQAVAGTAEDLDAELEAASIEHLMKDEQADEQ